ncbi:MAG: protein kinase [Elusimicrobiota bacterium]|jgi:serine/threonine protein kinase|nr:protein kinase [Elusimicrobiota bacterium]
MAEENKAEENKTQDNQATQPNSNGAAQTPQNTQPAQQEAPIQLSSNTPATSAPHPQSQTPSFTPPKKPELALIGQEISGCVILEKISEGGMGTVFKAKHKALDRIVCVKILSPALASDKKAVGLFLTEARAIAEIDHPNIVFVYNVGRERGFYFIVMSFIEGESLSSIVRKRPNLPISFVVETFIGILKGLEAAHQKGIIHRDIKPSNILINKKLEPKIVDFGIAKKIDKDKGSIKTTELAGTAYFLSPEQALGRSIDTRADLYSVGASLFYVLTGKYPFTGKNSMDIIQKHINEPVPEVSRYRKGIPPWLSAAITKLMSKDPKDRFQTAGETLLYFQKMRADDQLKINQGLNISDEMGLKISTTDMGTSPRLDERKPQIHTNRFNMEMDNTPVKKSNRTPSIPLVGLGSPKKTATSLGQWRQDEPKMQNIPKITDTQREIEERKKMILRQSHLQPNIDPSTIINTNKNKVFLKGLLFTILTVFMMIAAVFIFLKLGAICHGVDTTGKNFWQAALAPWITRPYLPGQIPLASAGFVMLVATISLFFFDIIKKAAPLILLVALASYLAGFMGWTTVDAKLFYNSSNYMLVFAFVFAALAIKIDDSNSLPFVYRVLSSALFAFSFLCIYRFCAPLYVLRGELTASLFYSTAGLVCATCVLPFLRGSYIFRLATWAIFAASCASIWVYQASGNAYYSSNEIEEQLSRPKPAYTLQLTPDELAQKAQFSAAQKASLKPEVADADEEDEAIEQAPLLTPKEARANFIKQAVAVSPDVNQDTLQNLIWRYALKEPFVKAYYQAHFDNVALFAIIGLIIYGLFAFIISVIQIREKRWNLT